MADRQGGQIDRPPRGPVAPRPAATRDGGRTGRAAPRHIIQGCLARFADRPACDRSIAKRVLYAAATTPQPRYRLVASLISPLQYPDQRDDNRGITAAPQGMISASCRCKVSELYYSQHRSVVWQNLVVPLPSMMVRSCRASARNC